MLFKQKDLEGIKSGKISLAFRKWKKPTVKKGSLIKTAVGQIEVVDISEIKLKRITKQDALNAGYKRLEDLIKALTGVNSGDIYKIKIRYHSPDPRIKLRQQTKLSNQELELLVSKLERLDKYSKQGSWTLDVLKAIRDNPKLRAADLAVETDKEKEWLKPNIRKLKNLGLTISHHPGYTLSPLGKVLLKKLGE